ncbi:hypothetical protein LMG28688_05312 [Paraburkholderia caffeinitolerans]|uniref:Uncharacterized protein n=1 Tax=Paraburkholderia caffeinitolerans TaxID=1723730 RepID=A0A6J5GI98_9BURK|nr:hypothetical protein [Paraburkholderia caffeinitolerans]CAB3801287.1 hypothetical protein LMG28688_05312 [Paraburkholderia caffeinitolerans]
MPDYQVPDNRGHFWTTWQVGAVPPNNMNRIILPHPSIQNYQFTHVKMDGIRSRDAQGGGTAALATAGLCGCTCVGLMRVRLGNAVRITMYHRTVSSRWNNLVNLFNSAIGGGAPQPNDVDYLIVATEGHSFADVAADLAGAGLNIPAANRFRYARSETHNLSFGLAMDRHAGELWGGPLDTAQTESNGFGDH